MDKDSGQPPRNQFDQTSFDDEEAVNAEIRVSMAASHVARDQVAENDKAVMVRLLAESSEFDEAWYLEQNEDVRATGGSPALHYVEYGAKEGRPPNNSFHAKDYLLLNVDVDPESIDPFLHYVTIGKVQRRPTRLDAHDFDMAGRKMVGPHFDYDLYDRRYPEAEKLGLDALTHFLQIGWREGADPNACFSTRNYQDANPDVKLAGINPFSHYLSNGRQEARALKSPFNWQRSVIRAALSTRERAAVADHQRHRVPLALDRMKTLIKALLPQHRGRFVISISHDEYTLNVGGVQTCIKREQRLLNEQGIAHIHLAPAEPSLTFRELCRPDEMTTLTIDGERLGHVRSNGLLKVLKEALPTGDPQVSLVVHSFLGHARETIVGLYNGLKLRHAIAWIHDCSTLCTNFALLRNDAEFCWSPPVDSWSCRVCVYGSERREHLANVGALFDALQPTFVFPSETIRDLWKARGYHAYTDTIVIPHAVLKMEGRRPSKKRETKVRVAFVGAPAAHKGWYEFLELANQFWGDPRYEFLHLGTHSAHERSVLHIPVTVHDIEKNEMVEVLQMLEIDVVVQWTLCFETFSFSTLEAIAAGCYVLVRDGSGNAAVVVEASGAGQLVETTDKLTALFHSSEIEHIVDGRRALSADLGYLEAPRAVDYLFGKDKARV